MNDTRTIAELGAEGGGLKVLGTRIDNRWRFRIELESDAWLYAEVDDAPSPGERILSARQPSRSEAVWFTSLKDALATVPWPWTSFVPVEIDPAFRAEIYALKRELDGPESADRWPNGLWREMCDPL